MGNKIVIFVLIVFGQMLVYGCASRYDVGLVVNHDSVMPGSKVTRHGAELSLAGTPIKIGMSLPTTLLVDADTLKDVDLSAQYGNILLISIVPSIDTAVCEAQTHYLAEEGGRLPAGIEKITVSRDTPFAQKRFAESAKLSGIRFLSDYKSGAFGRALGLLMTGPELLARSVLVVDRSGTVRYIQVVPEITNLPDMEKAFALSEKWLRDMN